MATNAPQKTTPAATDPAILQRLEQAERNYGVSPEISAVIMDLRAEYEDVFGSSRRASAPRSS